MNVKVNVGGVITLPADVVEQLRLKPGSELSFGRGPDGRFVVDKVDDGPAPTVAQIRQRLERVTKAARSGMPEEFAGMTTDEIMEFLRGD